MIHDCQEKTEATDVERHSMSRRRFVTFVLIGHLIVMLWNIPTGGTSGGADPNGLFAYYFTYTSLPTVFVAPFVPDSIRDGNVFFILLLINGVCVAWLIAHGLRRFVFGAPSGRGERST